MPRKKKKVEEVVETPVETTTQESAVQEVQLAPEVQAAMFLKQALPNFRKDVAKITGTQAKRILCALMEVPLEKETADFTTPEAEHVFLSGLMITNAKFILFTTGLKDDKIAASTEEEAKQAGAEAAAKLDNKEGNENGN